MNHFDIELIRLRKLSSSTYDFRFRRLDGSSLEFEPGQFFRFEFTDDKGEFERSYSLCNFEADVQPRHLDLVISTVENGRASRLLFESKIGLRAKASGPFGRLVLPRAMPQRLFLVATSVGIAPFMPMLAGLEPMLLAGVIEVHFLYGTRDLSEFIYGDPLVEFADRHSDFHLHVCFSRCDPVTAGQTRGYVQDALFKLTPNPATDHFLLCGNPKMIDDIYPKLKQLGLGVKQVVREKYVFAKTIGMASEKSSMSDEQKRILAEKMKKYSS